MPPRRLEDVFKICLQDVFKTCLQDVFSVIIFRLPRRLEDVLREILKTSSRRLGRRKIVTLKTWWRRLEDQQMFAGNEGWEIFLVFLLKTISCPCLLGSELKLIFYWKIHLLIWYISLFNSFAEVSISWITKNRDA